MSTPRRRPTRPGAPSALTEEAEKLLIDATGRGLPREVAAAAAGINVATFYRWLQRGRDVQEKVERSHENGGDYQPTDEESIYYDLLTRIEEAQAKAVTRAHLTMVKVSEGGYVTQTITRKFRDPVSGQVVEEVDERRASPEWRAAQFLLTRGPAKHLYTEAPKGLELSGPDGGAIRVSTDEEALAAKVTANMQAALGSGAAGELVGGDGDDDGVYDAEIIDDAGR